MFYGVTLAELGASGALLVAVCGLVVVFIMLAMLNVIIMLTSKLINRIDSQRPATAPASAAKSAPAPAAVAPVQDEDELVAVLMAAIAAESDRSPDSFQITNIQSR